MSRDVKVYQSLSKHYSDLRREIMNFFNPNTDSEKVYGLSSRGKLVKWVTYVSPSAGFAVKLKAPGDEYIKNIHTFGDFCNEFSKLS